MKDIKFYNKRLRILRAYFGWTLKDLSDKTEISKQTLCKYENGQVFPSFPSFLALCMVFNVKNDVFIEKEITFSVDDKLTIYLRGNIIHEICAEK